MDAESWAIFDDNRALTHTVVLILIIGSVLGIIFFTVYLPDGQLEPVGPNVEWEWQAENGDVIITHAGGESISRNTLYLYGDALDGNISNLGNRNDPRIKQPFDDKDVSQGDSMTLDGNALNEGEIRLIWRDRDSGQTSHLVTFEYPPEEGKYTK